MELRIKLAGERFAIVSNGAGMTCEPDNRPLTFCDHCREKARVCCHEPVTNDFYI
jgi:hypothetical protein